MLEHPSALTRARTKRRRDRLLDHSGGRGSAHSVREHQHHHLSRAVSLNAAAAGEQRGRVNGDPGAGTGVNAVRAARTIPNDRGSDARRDADRQLPPGYQEGYWQGRIDVPNELRGCSAMRQLQTRQLLARARVIDVDLDEETIELRLGEREDTAVLVRVLRATTMNGESIQKARPTCVTCRSCIALAPESRSGRSSE